MSILASFKHVFTFPPKAEKARLQGTKPRLVCARLKGLFVILEGSNVGKFKLKIHLALF